jgi:hypothetical protein
VILFRILGNADAGFACRRYGIRGGAMRGKRHEHRDVENRAGDDTSCPASLSEGKALGARAGARVSGVGWHVAAECIACPLPSQSALRGRVHVNFVAMGEERRTLP